MAKLKTRVTDLESVPEEDRGHYVEKDGYHVLDTEAVDGWSLENTSGLKKALKSERESVSELRSQLKVFDDLDAGKARDALKLIGTYEGIDPDKAREALGKIKNMENWTPEDKVREQIDARESSLREQMAVKEQKLRDEFNAANEKLRIERDARTIQLETEMMDNRLLTALSDNSMPHQVFKPIMRERLKMEQNGEGKYVVSVLNDKGEVLYDPDDPMARMTISRYASILKDDPVYAAYIPGSGASGGGLATAASDGTGRPQSTTQEVMDIKDPVERLKEFRRKQAAGA